MSCKLRILAFAILMLFACAQAYAEDFPLCCASFDGTTGTNCTPASNGQLCKGGVLVIFDCSNSGMPNALECSSVPAAKALVGSSPSGNNCRCVTVAFGSP